MPFIACCLMLLGTAAIAPSPTEPGPDAQIKLARYHHQRRSAPAEDPIAAPFTTSPVFKCDGGTGAAATHIDLWATRDGQMTGGIERIVKGEFTSTPIAAKYARQGPIVIVYEEEWKQLPHPASPMALGRAELRPKLMFRMIWNDQIKKWVVTLEDTKVVVQCQDWTKGGVNE